jgi:signal transduction histidine kinase
VAFAVAVTATGVALVLGPWIYRLARQLSDERRERIRSEERGEMAAHLHDSVLQTLAMIQRSASQQEMSSLARSQERELRAWLFGRAGPNAEIPPDASVSVAIDAMAARVERLQRVPVETVVVGDRVLDERLRSLVDACGEAVMNAARHSGAAEVSVYVEMDADGATAFVRDQGKGFDPSLIPSDRRGIADSIYGRMERIGGTASIVSSPGLGTEVRLRLPAAPRTAR